MSVDSLLSLIASSQPKDLKYFQEVGAHLKTLDVSTQTTQALAQALKRAYTLRKLAETAYEASEGKKELLGTIKELYGALEDTDSSAMSKDEWEMVPDDVDALLKTTHDVPGLRWRLPSLNKHLGSLRKGDFGFIFARPETGKTTFLVSEISYMAEQLFKQNQVLLHLNNEEQNNKVKLRYIQAVLNASLEQISSNRTKAQEVYLSRVGNSICLPNNTKYSRKDVEALAERYKPGLIVVDQIDKIEGFTDDREDLRLGSIYVWARDLAKEYCPVIGVCQADGSGENTKWLTMGNVANAKTAKQAEADFILGIGKIHDAGYESIRYLHLSKNKLLGDADTSGERHGKWEVVIKPDKARYGDIGS